MILGEGHGRFLEFLSRVNWTGEVTCVDSSKEMLKQAQRRIGNYSKNIHVTWLHADALSWKPHPHGYDLLVTHFFLDCFTEEQLQRLIPTLSSALKPGGKWMLADFCVPSAGLRRLRAKALLWVMYRFFRVATRLPARCLAVPDPFLLENSLRLEHRLSFDWGLLHTDLWIMAGEAGVNIDQGRKELLPIGARRPPASAEAQHPAGLSGIEAHAN